MIALEFCPEDRFQFRALVTLSLYDDNGDDVEKKILLENITLHLGGDIGISVDEFLNQVELTEKQEQYLYNEYMCSEEWFIFTPEKIEQSTGAKDSTKWAELTATEQEKWLATGKKENQWRGKLIFEGDDVSFDYTPTPADADTNGTNRGTVSYASACFWVSCHMLAGLFNVKINKNSKDKENG